MDLCNSAATLQHELAGVMAELKPRSVLVTGSNQGIGLELVKQLLGRSSRPEIIFATCRDPEGQGAQELKALAAKHKGVEVIPLDISKTSSVQSAAAQVREQLKGAGLNLLINNAGIIKSTPVLDKETAEGMSEVYRTNVIGPLEVSQAFLPLLKRASQESTENGMSCSRAAIINVSSEAGSIQNMRAWDLGHVASYRCSKAALNMLTRCQGLAYADDKILCVALHPGWVQTDMGNFGNRLAPLTLEASVQSILDTLARLSEKDTGAFVNWEGGNRSLVGHLAAASSFWKRNLPAQATEMSVIG